MWTTIGIVLFALGLMLSIALHEAGHLTFAKLFGVRVTQYIVGFGPNMFSRTRGGTEYGIKAVPLGGYVRMIGMVPPGKTGAPTVLGKGPFRSVRKLIEDSRAADRRQVTDADHGREFYQLHPGKRIFIMFAGPLMNLVIALGLFAIILLGIGAPVTVPTIASVSACVLPASATVRTCPENATPTPAAAARLQAGDTIVAFDGQPISSWGQVSTLIHAAAGRTVPMTYERAGEAITVQIPIVVNEIPVFDTNDNLIGTAPGGFLGIKAATEHRRESIGGAVGLAGDPEESFGQITCIRQVSSLRRPHPGHLRWSLILPSGWDCCPQVAGVN